jgi:RNA polymerase primary sigma factor
MMSTRRPAPELSRFAEMDRSQTEVLGLAVERALLQEMADCKRKLARALEDLNGTEAPRAGDDPQALARFIADTSSRGGLGHASLGAVHRRYNEIRTRLALANMKLVAHVAKRFRDRGIPYPDLMQEGFCGLLEAINRFDLSRQTKLATYATWWIRQAMQRAVASGAYPVRLTPRHLRQLAQDQEQRERAESDGHPTPSGGADGPGADIIHFIRAATRPAVSLDATRAAHAGFSLLQTISDPDPDPTSQVDTDEAINRLMEVLRPREQEVLSLRFGLGGRERLSLSQVGRLLDVSKERVRQIEDRALEKLKARADEQDLGAQLSLID